MRQADARQRERDDHRRDAQRPGVASGEGFGTDNAGVPTSSTQREPVMATTEETRTQYQPSRVFDERVQSTPRLKRLSVALFVDESVEPERMESLRRLVSAAVNLDETRQDVLTAERLQFLVPEASEDAAETAPLEELPSGPSPMLETLLTRGVEILTAVVFLFFLAKSLKSAAKGSGEAAAPAMVRRVGPDGTVTEVPATQESEIDPELLARLQIEQLLDSDPEKVGQILSSWARGEDVETGAAA